MKFQILHESRGRIRLRAFQARMSMDQADQLEEYAMGIPGVERVTIHESTRSLTIFYRGSRDALAGALSRFSYEQEDPDRALTHSSRKLSAEYKEKILRHAAVFAAQRLLLPAPVRQTITLMKAVPYVAEAVRTLLSRKMTVEVLDGTAIGVSLATGDCDTASSVMFLLRLGEYLDEWTHKKSVDDLARSMSLNVDQAWLHRDNEAPVLMPLARIREGDLIEVNTGHVIPLDGTIEQGDVMINQASLTGESVPVHKAPGMSVYAGSVLEEGSCVLRVAKTAGSNKYDQIVRMIEDSEKLKSEVETRASSLADSLVPWCLGGSLVTYLLTGNITRAVSVLMVDFSCALKLSMPLSVLSSMREASRYRITVKGGKFLEKVSSADTIIFDKTGTLTNACPTVAEVLPFAGNDPDAVLRVAACLEEHFPHSMANAVVRAARERNLEHEEMHSEVEYIVAHGIATRIGDRRAVIGSRHFVFEDEKAEILPGDLAAFESLDPRYSHLYLAIGGILSGVICISDPLRPEVGEMIRGLHQAGIGNVVMLTGDSRRTAMAIAREAGVDHFRAEVLPEDKAAYIRSEHEEGRSVIMIGDGINDAPALSLADVGVAIGSGAMIAREVADITIAAEDLRRILVMKQLSDALMKRIRSNYRFVMTFNGALILLGAFGLLTPSFSALLHNTSTLLLSISCMTDLLPQS